ncbi:MAG: Peptidase family [Frankiales bacterium]|nr:Peptidase family [Frankiales bacterium]
MADVVCLQGGAEFSPACADMDRAVLDLTGPGPVVVLPSAAAPGREYATAGANAVTYYTGLGADVAVAPDPREDLLGAVQAIRTAALVVLPGGSPGRLVEALVQTVLGAAVAAAPAISGASAGAMVLCATTVLPDVADHPLVPGCGIVPDALVIPHFAGALRWIEPGREGPRLILGLPECSGVIITDGKFTAVGTRPTTVFDDGVKRVVPVGESWQP